MMLSRLVTPGKTMKGGVSYFLVLFYQSRVTAGLTVYWELRSNYSGCHREEELLKSVSSPGLTSTPQYCRSLQQNPEKCLQITEAASEEFCLNNLMSRLNCKEGRTKVGLCE